MTLTELEARREALLLALSDPNRVVEFEQRRVERHDLAGLRQALAEIDRQIAGLQTTSQRRTFVVTTSRGFE
jgi:hypothetical protein